MKNLKSVAEFKELKDLKIALVFDWLTTAGGAERVNLILHQMFPEAPIYTCIYNSERVKGFEKAKIYTSALQKFPFAKKYHQFYIGLMPSAYEAFDLSSFDLVISSCHAASKGVLTGPKTLHVCYCHNPMRYCWDDWHGYLDNYGIPGFLTGLAKKRMHKLRIWDRIAAERVDYFIANSNTTKRRIEKYYNRRSEVIFPMVDFDKYQKKITWNEDLFQEKVDAGEYYLALGRLTAYKKFDLLVETFNKLGLPLKIVGNGVDRERLKKLAKQNVEFLGFVSEEDLVGLYQNCKAFVFPQLEDFGIVPLEAMACGKPVIAYGAGGALDTVIDGETGVYFEEQTLDSLALAIEKFEERCAIGRAFDSEKIRQHAKTFDVEVFKEKVLAFVREKV